MKKVEKTSAAATQAAMLVRNPDHCALEHGRVCAGGLLDLDAGDVLAAGNDDVFASVAQLDVVGVPNIEPAVVELVQAIDRSSAYTVATGKQAS
jgi:hypothetical protein